MGKQRTKLTKKKKNKKKATNILVIFILPEVLRGV